MKVIVIQNTPEDSYYKVALRVRFSTHPRFIEGTRFDWGFAGIALDEGYTLTMHPLEENQP